MRPSVLLESLRRIGDPLVDSIILRTTSGAETRIEAAHSWFVDEARRSVSVIADGRTTITIDMMLIEAAVAREIERPALDTPLPNPTLGRRHPS